MFLLIPYEVRTLIQRSPWANLGIMSLTIVASLLSFFGVWTDAAYDHFILTRNFDLAIIGHMLMHAGWLISMCCASRKSPTATLNCQAAMAATSFRVWLSACRVIPQSLAWSPTLRILPAAGAPSAT